MFLLSGGKIWCEIVEDLKQGTELLASFTTNQDEAPDGRTSVGMEKTEAPSRDLKLAIPGVKKHDSKSSVTPQPGKTIYCKIIVCFYRL